MVVGEKHYKHTDEGPVKNMRRNRSPSGASRGSTEDGATAAASNNGDDGSGMREGPEYQATIPEYNPNCQTLKLLPDSSYATLLWLPNSKSLDAKVDCYIEIAREKYGYAQEQALGMLFWHGHNVDRALSDLPNFTPSPDDWTLEDKVLFEQAFNFHGKNFHRIHLMLPDKSIGNLVKYYYSWKKTRHRVSLLDRQAQLSGQCGNGSERDIIDDSDSDFESAKETQKEDTSIEPVRAVNRSKTEIHNRLRNKHKPPSGIYISYEDLKAMAACQHGHVDSILKPIDMELESLKRRVIANKQELISYKQRTACGIDSFRPAETPLFFNPKWTHSELLLAVQGIRHYGKNFTSIAELIGTKTEHLVRNFFYNYRVQYNLDDVLREYEEEHGKKGAEIAEDGPVSMEVDGTPNEMTNPVLSSSPPPPPLMKQLYPLTGSRHSHHQPDNLHKPPVLQHANKNTPSSGRMILHQPPPLFKHGPSLTSSAIVVSK